MIALKVSEGTQQERLSICKSCEKFYEPTNTCKVCGCFMNVKTWYPRASCPLHKWHRAEVGAG